MIIEPQSVELISHTPDPEALIANMARICYMSGEGDDSDLIRKLIKNKHESQLEHSTATFKIVCDRGISHEIVRHRIGIAYSMTSTRFCNFSHDKFGNEITVISPFEKDSPSYPIWLGSCMLAESSYFDLLKKGATPQFARSVLPTSLKTVLGVTGNFRAWRHFLTLRSSPKAHPQIRQIAHLLAAKLYAIAPNVFEEFNESRLE